MFSFKITSPEGYTQVYRSGKEAAKAIGVTYETLKKLAVMNGYTRTGMRVSYMDLDPTNKPIPTSTRRRPLSVTLSPEAYDRLLAEAERTGESTYKCASRLLESTVMTQVPPVSPQG